MIATDCIEGALIMSRVIVVLIGLLMMPLTCFAMTFSQPIKIGSAGAVDASFDVYEIKGAFYSRDGVSKLGDKDDFICFYQRPATTNFSYGVIDINNTFPFLSYYGCDFTQIKTTDDITFYMIHEYQADITGEAYILLGNTRNGKWFKYFDTRDLTKKYFGKIKTRYQHPCYTSWYCNGDMIAVVYQRMNERSHGFVNEGEFRFKWDEAAQWFGVEQIVY